MGKFKQLREEVYRLAKRKLHLEKEIKTMTFYISTLKKELDARMPVSSI